MSIILQQLIDGNDLTQPQAQQFFDQVIKGDVAPELLASVLTALKIKSETADEIGGAALAVRNSATPFPPLNFNVSDCVGTGGDGSNTINISTTAAILAAACGIKMAKHGNRSVSSMSGSADLLEAFGANLTMSPEVAAQCLAKTNFCFLYAPAYHPGFKHAGPVRKAMGVRTLFNILGPLVNPAQPKTMVLGVYTPELLPTIARALQITGVESAWVVHGSGLDELALHGDSQVIAIENGQLVNKTLSPSDFGLAHASLEDIKGGTPQENAEIIKNILQGKGELAHNNAVLINCAALLYMHNKASSLIECTNLAREVLLSGKGYETLMAFVKSSQGQ